MKHASIMAAGLFVAACVTATASDYDSVPVISSVEQAARDRFPRVDFNGDGLLTAYEYKEYQKAMFAKHYDFDSDGVLKIGCTIEDFSQRMRMYGSQHPTLTECYRAAGEKPIEFTFEIFFASHASWHALADTDGDGFVSVGEYVSAFTAK